MGLTLADIGDLLDQPIVAVLATYRRDGTVLLSPVWFEHRDGLFQVWCGSIDEGKVRHVLHDPRASLVIAEQTVALAGRRGRRSGHRQQRRLPGRAASNG